MIIMAHVQHFFNTEGKEIFPTWFKKIKNILLLQPGFISIEYAYDPKEDECINIWLKFTDSEKLQAWANTPLHHQLAAELNLYRIKPYTSIKYNLEESM